MRKRDAFVVSLSVRTFGFDDSMRERGNNQTVRDFVDARVAPHLGVD